MKKYNDVFVEELVTRRRPMFIMLVRIGTIVAALVLIGALYYLSGLLLGEYANAVFPALFAVVCIGVYLVFRNMALEYEYAFFSGDVDIDKIIGKRKRSTVMSFSCRDIEIIAPYGPKYESMISGSFDETLDARGIGAGTTDWFLICRTNEKSKLLAFSPSDRMLEAFRGFAKKQSFKED